MAAAVHGTSILSRVVRWLDEHLRQPFDRFIDRMFGDSTAELVARLRGGEAVGGGSSPVVDGDSSFEKCTVCPGGRTPGNEEAPVQPRQESGGARSRKDPYGMGIIDLVEGGTAPDGSSHFMLPDEHAQYLTAQAAVELDALEAWAEPPSPLPAVSVGALPAPPTRLALPLDVSTLSAGDIVDSYKISPKLIGEVCTRLCRSGLAFSNVTSWTTQKGHTAFAMTGLGDADTTRITTCLDPVLGTVEMWGPPGVLGATATERRTYCRFTLLDEAGKPLEDQALNHALAGMAFVQGKMGRAACENAGILPPLKAVSAFSDAIEGGSTFIRPQEKRLEVHIQAPGGTEAVLWCSEGVCGGEMTTPGGETTTFDHGAITSGAAAATFAEAAAAAATQIEVEA